MKTKFKILINFALYGLFLLKLIVINLILNLTGFEFIWLLILSEALTVVGIAIHHIREITSHEN